MAYQNHYQSHLARGLAEKGHCGAALTGTIAAGLASGGAIWTFRYPEATQGRSKIDKRLVVERIHVHTVTGTAFTTPVTLGRHLALFRAAPTSGTASDPSGGAAWTAVRKNSIVTSDTLGVGRVATTAALTLTGITVEANPFRRFLMAHQGASGADYDESWLFDGNEADPLILHPGQLLVLAAGATFDAVGTFEAAITVDAVEVP